MKRASCAAVPSVSSMAASVATATTSGAGCSCRGAGCSASTRSGSSQASSDSHWRQVFLDQVGLHLVDADALFGGAHVVLRIADGGDTGISSFSRKRISDWNINVFLRTRLAMTPMRFSARLILATSSRSAMQREAAWMSMSEGSTGTMILLRVARELGQGARFDGGGAVHHDLLRAFGHAHLPGARGARVVLERGDARDDRLRRLALAQPARGRALRVAIDEQSGVATRGEIRREIDRERRLARAPFRV